MARTRRRTRTAALTAVVALALAACGGDDDPTVEVEGAGSEAIEEDADDEAADAADEVEEPEETPEPETDEEEADADAEAQEPEAPEDDGDAAAGPTADPELVADPCGPHAGREGDAFIEVVSPVAEQQVTGDSVELVGCSNVFEANVQWSLYDGDGRELDSGFTTAECGNGCVGAFSEEVSLEAAEGEPFAELHVYAEDVSGEADRLHLNEIPLVLG